MTRTIDPAIPNFDVDRGQRNDDDSCVGQSIRQQVARFVDGLVDSYDWLSVSVTSWLLRSAIGTNERLHYTMSVFRGVGCQEMNCTSSYLESFANYRKKDSKGGREGREGRPATATQQPRQKTRSQPKGGEERKKRKGRQILNPKPGAPERS